MEKDSQYYIDMLQLKPHREGGFYAESYKSNDFNAKNPDASYGASLIYFLLRNQQISAFHKLKNDEIWIYHSGSSVNIYMINKVGELKIDALGANLDKGDKLQVLVSAETWFAADLTDKTSFCLMTCLVSPGFNWNDFELGAKEVLLLEFPKYKTLIEKYCI